MPLASSAWKLAAAGPPCCCTKVSTGALRRDHTEVRRACGTCTRLCAKRWAMRPVPTMPQRIGVSVPEGLSIETSFIGRKKFIRSVTADIVADVAALLAGPASYGVKPSLLGRHVLRDPGHAA